MLIKITNDFLPTENILIQAKYNILAKRQDPRNIYYFLEHETV